MLDPAATEEEQPTEAQRVIFRRYIEARDAGLTVADARVFAESETDIGELRRLVKSGCDPRLISRILL